MKARRGASTFSDEPTQDGRSSYNPLNFPSLKGKKKSLAKLKKPILYPPFQTVAVVPTPEKMRNL